MVACSNESRRLSILTSSCLLRSMSPFFPDCYIFSSMPLAHQRQINLKARVHAKYIACCIKFCTYGISESHPTNAGTTSKQQDKRAMHYINYGRSQSRHDPTSFPGSFLYFEKVPNLVPRVSLLCLPWSLEQNLNRDPLCSND